MLNKTNNSNLLINSVLHASYADRDLYDLYLALASRRCWDVLLNFQKQC